nr:hypothetical protein [Micromonospora sp. DSM 115978]
ATSTGAVSEAATTRRLLAALPPTDCDSAPATGTAAKANGTAADIADTDTDVILPVTPEAASQS